MWLQVVYIVTLDYWLFQTVYLDSIETNIENAVVDIQQGNTQLRQARDHQVKYFLSSFSLRLAGDTADVTLWHS